MILSSRLHGLGLDPVVGLTREAIWRFDVRS
jgi:hypothetical protein